MRIDCLKIKEDLINELKCELAKIESVLTLAIVQVEGDGASDRYVANKIKLCEELGVGSRVVKLPNMVSQAELERVLSVLALDKEVTGLMLQLPLPSHLKPQQAIEFIPHQKDVDGLTTFNQGLLFTGQLDKCLMPCTVIGVMEVLESRYDALKGLNVAVVGRSQLFGNSMAQILMRHDATVTLCHSKSKLNHALAFADVIISAVGIPHFIDQRKLITSACETVIDVGMSLIDGKLVGDVDTTVCEALGVDYTTTPRGTGALTTTCLLMNTVRAYKLQTGLIE